MTVDPRWFSVAGLFCDLIGAGFLALGLIVSKRWAVELGVSRWSGGTEDQQMSLPAVRDRVFQARNATIGVALLGVGFALQIYGNWPR